MVQISDALTWELVKCNSSFLKKKNGHTRRTGTIEFSTEPGNVKSLNRRKFSGLSNSKALDVRFADDNKAVLFVKTASKAHNKPKASKQEIPINKDFRRVEKVVKGQSTGKYYRADLQDAVLAKYTKVYQANRRAKGIKKVVPTKKGRGTN